MLRSSMLPGIICPATALLLVTGCTAGNPSTEEAMGEGHEALVALFDDWRAFEKPGFIDGVPDYTDRAMARQHRDLNGYRHRLAAIDTTGWPVSEQVDYWIVRAEMNGLDFYHRVSRPWAQNPAFYVMIFPSRSDVPAHEGPDIHGWIDLWTWDNPLEAGPAMELAERIAVVPRVLDQARINLTGNARDLWRGGIRAMEGQSRDLRSLADRVAGTDAGLDSAIEAARQATDAFAAWLEAEAPSKTGPSGVGRENYTWYERNVHLVPFSWEEQMTMLRRELARSSATLLLEEHRNRDLPEQERIDTAEEYDRRFNQAVTDYIDFYEEEEIITVRDYFDEALRERIGRFSPAEGLRGFFSEVSYRDPLTMRTHGHHWIDLAMMDREPHASPIRRVSALYNIYDSRSEGIATGMEEWMMHAGLFDDNPRSRELILILIAQRAARAIGGLMMHADEWTIEEAVEFASRWTPRGYMPENSDTVWGEQYFYLTQPGYATSYLIGKHQVEQLMSERALQLGDRFTVQGFFDDLHAAGVVPMSLLRWEMTGETDEISDLNERVP